MQTKERKREKEKQSEEVRGRLARTAGCGGAKLEAHWPGWLRTVTRINYDVITSLAITIGGQDGRQIGSLRDGQEWEGKTEVSASRGKRASERERKLARSL